MNDETEYLGEGPEKAVENNSSAQEVFGDEEQKRAQVSVEIDPVTDEGMIPADFEGDAKVEWQGESRLIRIRETRPERNTHPSHRYFTLEGGFPIDWYEDELTAALSKALDARMMAIPKLV